MRTRSQTNDTSINFEDASKWWNANKRRVENTTTYTYICGATCGTHYCQKRPVKHSRHCIIHGRNDINK